MNIKRAGLLSLGLRLVNIVLVFSFAMLAAKYMGASEYGKYSFFISAVFVGAIPVKAGLPTFVLREISRLYACERYIRMAQLLLVSSLLMLLLALFVFLVLMFLKFLEVSAFERFSFEVLVCGSLIGLLISLNALRASALQGARKIVISQIPEMIIVPGCLVLGILALMYCDVSLQAERVMWLYVVSAALAFGLGSFLLCRVIPLSFDVTLKFGLPRDSMNAHMISLLALSVLGAVQLVNSQVDLLILGLHVEYEEVGSYKLALQFATIMALPMTVAAAVIGPYIVSYFHEGKISELHFVIRSAARAAFVTGLVFSVLLYYGASVIIRCFLGEEYNAAVELIGLMCFFNVLILAFGTVLTVANLLGLEKFTLYSSVVAVLLNVVLCLLLIPEFGSRGAAISTGASMVVWKLVLSVVVYRKQKVNASVFAASRSAS